MDTTTFISPPRGTKSFPRSLAGTKLSLLIECTKRATARNGRTPPDILQLMFNKKTNRSRTGDKSMKTKILIATLLGCLVWQQGALSQTDTIATNPATATDAAAPANQPAAVTDSSQVAKAQSATARRDTANPPTAPAVAANESPAVAASRKPPAPPPPIRRRLPQPARTKLPVRPPATKPPAPSPPIRRGRPQPARMNLPV